MSKHRLGLLTVSVLPASLHSAVVIYSPNLTITEPASIYFSPSSGEFNVTSAVAADGVVLSYFKGGTYVGGQSPTVEVAYYLSSDSGANTANAAVNFLYGATIDATAQWLPNGSGAVYLDKPGYSTSFPAGTRGYVGLRYGAGTDWNYAWADVSYNADQSLTLHRFANETTLNLGIQAIPESGAGVAGALVAGALGAWKARERYAKRRQAAAVSKAA
jgi:hypothetical protein